MRRPSLRPSSFEVALDAWHWSIKKDVDHSMDSRPILDLCSTIDLYVYIVILHMCKFETVYQIYKSMSSVLTPQVFLKPQTSPPPFRAFRNHRVLTSKVREFFIASEQFLYSRFLPIKLHPFITSFNKNQGQNSAAEKPNFWLTSPNGLLSLLPLMTSIDPH